MKTIVLALAASLFAVSAPAATYTVNSTAHGTDASSATTTLVEAIQKANTAGGTQIIELAAGATYLADDTVYIDNTERTGRTLYPRITCNLTINGNGATLDATGKKARFFVVGGSGALTLNQMNLVGAKAKGGNG
ncbi:MAG: hypothetical protein EBS05_04375, partial [Proteobacteria bacterium]|nr:hypothetical protein [Pseudomonadota bacterium]